MSFAGLLDFMRKDVTLKNDAPSELLRENHFDFLLQYQENKESYEYIMSEPLRVSGIYWCVSAMDILGKLDTMPKKDILEYVKACQNSDGGFAPSTEHDSHLLHTLCAVQIFTIFDALSELDSTKIVSFVKTLQNDDGSFRGDESDEIDTRFSLCGLATLYLLGALKECNTQKAVDFILQCYNFDGGFGTRPGSESHSGQVFCCIGSLAITGMLDCIDRDKTAQWLVQRQCDSGGLNGRPEKLPDVCYSWWVLSALKLLKRINWLDKKALTNFIYACQDVETGGIADRPGDYPDPFHTVFGLAALSLLDKDNLEPVDAVFCMTKRSLGKLSLS